MTISRSWIMRTSPAVRPVSCVSIGAFASPVGAILIAVCEVCVNSSSGGGSDGGTPALTSRLVGGGIDGKRASVSLSSESSVSSGLGGGGTRLGEVLPVIFEDRAILDHHSRARQRTSSVCVLASNHAVGEHGSMAFVSEPARQTPILSRAQVVVLGGGPSGIAAAAAAARAGAKVALVERYGFLGGMGTAAMVTSFCGLHANVHGEIRRVVHGLADEILDRLEALGGLNRTHSVFGKTAAQSYDVGAYKCVADDLVADAGVDLHLHAFAVGVLMEGRAISALLVETKSGRGAITGDVFIDCSGDADLAA